MKYILALDQGTTSSRTLLFNEEAELVGMSQKEFQQYFPQSGWVEHDPLEIWETQLATIHEVIEQAGIDPTKIVGLGITNQRETTVIWNKQSGQPIHHAIVWQDKRTSAICEQLKKDGLAPYVSANTGLVIDSYFSGTKIKWLLDEVEGARELAMNGDLLAGTIDTWLVWKLTKGKVHATDYTNASRTMLFNIKTLQWDHKLLEVLEIPENILPAAYPCMHHFGDFELNDEIALPITGIAGDQQAALFGQACFEEGMAKNTYGTGCFMLMNTGNTLFTSKNNLLTTIAFASPDEVHYALEGSVFIAGAAIQWLRDGLEIIQYAADSEQLAEQAAGDDVVLVPAFTGLGAPYWDMYARGAIFGLSRDTGKEHIAKAALQSLAYQTKDLLAAMQDDSGIALSELKVDGGACANNYLMQFQADMLGVPVERPKVIESTALGAAFLAGIYLGLWTKEDVVKHRVVERNFEPNLPDEKVAALYRAWKKAVARTMGWLKE
ncbi:MAG: glycerol kinase GlpK [Flammeovirgaceae bacterium]